MNLINEVYHCRPDIFSNDELAENEQIVWSIQPPTVAEVQKQNTEKKRTAFYQYLLDHHIVAIRNMTIAGEKVETVKQMERLATKHLNPRQNKMLSQALLKAISYACFLDDDEIKN